VVRRYEWCKHCDKRVKSNRLNHLKQKHGINSKKIKAHFDNRSRKQRQRDLEARLYERVVVHSEA
jgi:hypothetical protein